MFETYEWLRNKKSAFPGQTQQEKWQSIYDRLFLSDESLLTFDLDNLDRDGSSIQADVTSTASNNSLDLLETYLPSAEAIVARRLEPVETRLLEQVSRPNQQFQRASFGSTQNQPPSSTEGCHDKQTKVSHSPAESGFEAYFTPMPSIETPRAVDLVDFGTGLPEHDDFDSLLNSCFSPYIISPLPPTQYSDQNFSYDFCSTCMGPCVCQGRMKCHSNVPGTSESSAQSSSNNASVIQQLMQRIEALEKRQEFG
ncbi:hypothetical protein BDZ45DRAFT_808240 [Acephala macrosclerotiorum]|nr:hypothetical protein BDZ45DRAFT_808240 [Acephala macrosclerotiorum]